MLCFYTVPCANSGIQMNSQYQTMKNVDLLSLHFLRMLIVCKWSPDNSYLLDSVFFYL